jgi:two-component system, LytTR family, sensor kinase
MKAARHRCPAVKGAAPQPATKLFSARAGAGSTRWAAAQPRRSFFDQPRSILDLSVRGKDRKAVSFRLFSLPVTVRFFLHAYSRHPWLRVAAHLVFWAGMYLLTEDPDAPNPVPLRLLEWGYAAGSFYLLFYGPVPRQWAQGRYAAAGVAGLAVGLGTGWLLYWQNRIGSPHSAFARSYLPAYEQYGVLAIFQSVRVFYYALLEGVLVNIAGPAALKIAKVLYDRQLVRHRLEQLTRRGQLTALLQQVSPHFLFNALNNLYGLVLQDDPRAGTFTNQLRALVHHTDAFAGQPRVSLRQEAQFIEDYLALTRLRYDRRVTVESSWQLGPDPLACLPPLLLLPMVENAVKHGLQHAVGPAWVRIHATVRDGDLAFVVTNSLAAAPVPGSAGGLGLTTLRERLRVLYPTRSPLQLLPATASFEARLLLPLEALTPAHGRAVRADATPVVTETTA